MVRSAFDSRRLAQDVVAFVEQCAHPGSAIGPVTVGEVAADDALEVALPGAQPISARHVGIRQPLPQQPDKLVQPRLTQIGRGRRADPLHMLIPRRVLRQHRPVSGQHLAPVAVRVDFRHHPDDEIGVVGRQIDERTVGFRQRSDCGHGEHHRGRSVRRRPVRRPQRTCARATDPSARRSGWWSPPATGRPPARHRGSPRPERSGRARSPPPRRRPARSDRVLCSLRASVLSWSPAPS